MHARDAPEKYRGLTANLSQITAQSCSCYARGILSLCDCTRYDLSEDARVRALIYVGFRAVLKNGILKRAARANAVRICSQNTKGRSSLSLSFSPSRRDRSFSDLGACVPQVTRSRWLPEPKARQVDSRITNRPTS